MLRCEDCIPLIEEYFDGEVDEQTTGRMSAHISACADCAAALDALSFEGEIYARYERGLEPTPALWARVSAEIARAPQPETPAKRQPFLSRTLESVAAALGALSLRPALASSLALLVVGITAGSLWLARRPQPVDSPFVAMTEKKNNVAPASTLVALAPSVKSEVMPGGDVIAKAAGSEKGSRPSAPNGPSKSGGEGKPPISLEELLRDPQPSRPDAAVKIDADGHAGTDDIAGLVDAPKADAGFVMASAQLPDAGEKEMARHVEQTQMLLRSIKNARASDDGSAVNVAYEKNLSRQLLADNATLKLEAEVKGDRDTKQVLDTIEPFLLDIANMRDQPSREEVRSFRERVKKTEIIASLQVY